MIPRQLRAAAHWAASLAQGSPQYLVLYVTSRCNARCRMCFNWDGMAARRAVPTQSLEELTRLAQTAGRVPHLTLSGGEPLMRDDVAEILHAFHRHAGTPFFTVPTNSLRPDRVGALIHRFADLCPGAFLNFCLPFHGPEAVHDDIMGIPGAFAKRDETLRVVEAARAAHPNISCTLNCVLSQFNHQHWRETLDLALGPYAGIPFGVAYARGVTHERDAVNFPLESYLKMYGELLARRRVGRSLNPYPVLQAAMAREYRDTVAGVVAGRIRNLPCRAGSGMLVVFDDGKVYPCETLVNPECCTAAAPPADACMGDLHDTGHDLAALLRGGKARNILRWRRQNLCACTWECAVTNSALHSPRTLLRLGGSALRQWLSGKG